MRVIGNNEAEAIEAWNTWPGRYKRPDRFAFVKANSRWRCPNPAQLRDIRDAIAAGGANSEDILYGSVTMLHDGTFEVPWPRIAPFQANVSGYTALDVFLLRVRWSYIIEDEVDYRSALSSLLKSMDRDGKSFDSFAKAANVKLLPLDLPPLQERDLRGVNLSGLDLSGDAYEGVCLRHFDLSFAEISMAELDGANLYSCKLLASSAANTNLRYAILSSADLTGAMMPAVDLSGADLSFANFTDALCHRATLDGAQLHQTDFSSAQLTDVSMREECRKGTSALSIRNLKYDSSTRLTFRVSPTNLAALPKELVTSEARTEETLSRVVGSAVGLRPGLFGVSIDLKAIGTFLYRRFLKRLTK